MKIPLVLEHTAPAAPCSNLLLYQQAFEATQIENVHLPRAEEFWREPEKHAVPEHQPAGSMDWGLHDMKVMFCSSARKYCNDQIRKEVGDDLAENIRYLMTVARVRLGIRSSDFIRSRNLTELYTNWSEAVWGKLAQAIRNPGVGVFVQDSGSLLPRSVHIPAFFMTGPVGNRLEGAYGYGLDIAGNYSKIDGADPMSLWVPKSDLRGGDPGFIYERDRSGAIFQDIREARHIMAIGAGWLPEVRHAKMFYGAERLNWGQKRLVAYDDGANAPEEFHGSWKTPEGMTVIYQRMELPETLARLITLARKSFDFVYAKDVFSRYPEMLEIAIARVIPLLRQGGKFKFDLILDHPISRRAILLFGDGARLVSGETKLRNLQEAMEFVDATIHAASERIGTTLNWSCEIDQQEAPLGLMFTIYGT